MKKTLCTALAVLILAGVARIATAHCEIPCGIYGDKMRIVMIREHLATIEKSMKQIEVLGAAEKPNWNQLVRWVGNKEKHADEIQDIVTQYWLTQRIKVPATDDEASWTKYRHQCTLLHQLLVAAMKMKQTTDAAHVENARKLLTEFAGTYFSEEDMKHLSEHD